LSLDFAFINNSTANSKPSLNYLNSNYSDDIQYSIINYSSFWGVGVNLHNKNNTLYFVEIDFCTAKSKSTPISSYGWATGRAEGTFNYFPLGLGKTF